MRKLLLATTLLATSAFGADLQVRPLKAVAPITVCSWCGLYFGANAGYGGADFIANFTEVDQFGDVRSLSAKHSANSVAGGAHLGYNYVFGNFLVGAETDISITGIKQTTDGVETKLPWLGTTRLRAGLTIAEYLLIYGTGGVAYGHVKVGDAAGGAIATTPAVGWVVGAGAEYMLAQNIVIGAEYLH